MSVASTSNEITAQTLTYLPAVLAGIQAAEAAAPSASGPSKLQAVLDGIQAGSAVAAGIPVPQVAAIAALVNLSVSIFNALGIFKKKAPGK